MESKERLQEAILATAESYLLRGPRIQYDDTRLCPDYDLPPIYRWQRNLKQPEDYTSQMTGYTNCAAFTYDLYKMALGYDIKYWCTEMLIDGEDMLAYRYYPTGQETEAEKAAIEKVFRDAMEPGDILVIRYGGKSLGNGHAMLYVGGDDFIHSRGKNYWYSGKNEQYEPDGSIQRDKVSTLFDPENRRYAFGCVSFGIIRPLITWKGTLPENTVNRVENLRGILAEKLCSHESSGRTVNPGEKITYSFSITNTNSQAVTLEAENRIPEHCEEAGKLLSWQITVPAGRRETVSYTARVSGDAPAGSCIFSEGKIGGVKFTCPRVYVGRTLTVVEQAALLGTLYSTSALKGMDRINALYDRAFGWEPLPQPEAILKDAFVLHPQSQKSYIRDTGSQYASCTAPGMYGGRSVVEPEEQDPERTRFPKAEQLVTGDVLVYSEEPGFTKCGVSLFAGDTLWNMEGEPETAAAGLERVLSYHHFLILRPSMRQ